MRINTKATNRPKSEAKEKMNQPKENFYKVGEVSAMLDVSISTLHYWEKEFEQFDPFRTPGGTRKYRPEDIEVCRLIKHLLRDKGYSLEYAKGKLNEYYTTGQLNADRRVFTCESRKDAKQLLSALKIKCEEDAYAVARIKALESWIAGIEIVEEQRRPNHKNIRGKECFAECLAQKKKNQKE